MKTLFVDTAYWVAQANPRDEWHIKAIEFEAKIANTKLVTSELVLVEVLNYFSNFGVKIREKMAIATQQMLVDSDIHIVWQSQPLFELGLDLYQARLDKGYSLTDCVSMIVMRQEKIQEILTHDRHFAQEGFTILL